MSPTTPDGGAPAAVRHAYERTHLGHCARCGLPHRNWRHTAAPAPAATRSRAPARTAPVQPANVVALADRRKDRHK